MKFIEVVEGFSVRVDAIISVKKDGDTLLIETEGKEYKVVGDFRLFMEFLEEEDNHRREVEKITSQFFGG